MRSDELIAKKLDGELSPEEAAELQSLLSADPELAKELRELEALEESLDVQNHVNSAGARAFRADHKSELQASLMRSGNRRSGGVYWLGGMLTIVAVVLVTWLTLPQDPSEQQLKQTAANTSSADQGTQPANPNSQSSQPEAAQPQNSQPADPQNEAVNNKPTPNQTHAAAPQQQSRPAQQPANSDDAETPNPTDQLTSASEARAVTQAETPPAQRGQGQASLSSGKINQALGAEIERLNRTIASETKNILNAVSLHKRAKIERAMQDFTTAEATLLEALELLKLDKSTAVESDILSTLARTAHDLGKLDDARTYKQRALEICSPNRLERIQQELSGI